MPLYPGSFARTWFSNMSGTANGTFIYFSYGSNMLERRLKAADRAPSARSIGTGFVAKRRLTFHKISVDGSGKCDIKATGNDQDRVYGVLFEISNAEKAALDRVEGLGKGYDDEVVRVITVDGASEAITYVALMKAPDLKPYDWYKAFVIAGAVEHGLPGDYIDRLKAIESLTDPDRKRHAAQEAILANR